VFLVYFNWRAWIDQLKQDFEAEILVLESLTAYFYLEIGKLVNNDLRLIFRINNKRKQAKIIKFRLSIVEARCPIV
jgi:hypothetical protein